MGLLTLLGFVSFMGWIFTNSIDIGFLSMASFLFFASLLFINRLCYTGILDPSRAVASHWKLMILRVFTFVVILFTIIGNLICCFGYYMQTEVGKKGQNIRLLCATLYAAALFIGCSLFSANFTIWTEIKRRTLIRLNSMRRAWNAYYEGYQPGELLERRGENGR